MEQFWWSGCESRLITDAAGTFVAVEHEFLRISGFGHLWTAEHVYDLASAPVNVTCWVRLHESSEFCLALSANRKPWGSGDEDALTMRVGCMVGSTVMHTSVRKGMYREFLHTLDFDLELMQWTKVCVELHATHLIVWMDGAQLLELQLSAGDMPTKGAVGILSYSEPAAEVRTVAIASGPAPCPSSRKATAPALSEVEDRHDDALRKLEEEVAQAHRMMRAPCQKAVVPEDPLKQTKEALREMSCKELKQLATSKGISCKGCVEKPDLIHRLLGLGFQ